MTVSAKFIQISLLLQEMEHNVKVSLESKPSINDVRNLIKEEFQVLYDKLKEDLINSTTK